jgi:hypothetical protein
MADGPTMTDAIPDAAAGAFQHRVFVSSELPRHPDPRSSGIRKSELGRNLQAGVVHVELVDVER